jgi:hypothetical protein
MALTASRTTQGLELLRYTQPGEILHVPGDPGDTFTRGDVVIATSGTSGIGIVDPAGAAGIPVGRVAQTTVCPAATTAFPKPAAYDPADRSGANLCCVPIEPSCPAGTPVYLMTFASHTDDENIAAYTAGTPSITLTDGLVDGNDEINGGLVYVYGGPGIGEVNVVADFVAATDIATLHRAFTATLTTASDVIVVGGSAAGGGVGFFGRIDLADQNNLTANVADQYGEYVVYLDFRDAGKYLADLMLPVVPAAAFMNTSSACVA